MKRSFSILNLGLGALIGSAVTMGIGSIPHREDIAPPPVVLQVDLRPIPLRDEVMNVWPWPVPNACVGFETSPPTQLAPLLRMYGTDLPTLQADPPRSGLTEL